MDHRQRTMNFGLTDEEKLRTNGLFKSASFAHFAKMSDQELLQYYYTLPKQGSAIGVRLAPLAHFDDKDFELPKPSDSLGHKVRLFKALSVFFSSVILVSVA